MNSVGWALDMWWALN